MRRLEVRTRLALVAWAMAITIARAARFPNDFAEAHWLLDYRFGLIKRGAAGSLLSIASNVGLVAQSEAAVAAVAFTALAGFVLVLLWAASHLVSSDTDPGLSFAAAAVFATSPFIVMTAHFMGYLDHVFLAAAFVAACLARSGRMWAAATVAALGVLVHESFVLVGLPLALVGASLHSNARRSEGAAELFPFALPLLAALALWVSEALVLDRAVLRGQLEARLSAFPFVGGDMNLFVPEWLTTGTLETWRSQRHAFWRHLSDPNLLQIMVPSASFLVLAVAALSPAGLRTRRAVTSALVAGAPLVMHAVAWDTARIWTYTIVAAFGCVLLYGGGDRLATAAGRRWLLVAAGPVVLSNVFALSPLMDGQVERFAAPTRALLYLPFLAGVALAIASGWRQRAERA
jgi:hypothetical protein